jgi:hypothetical protein
VNATFENPEKCEKIKIAYLKKQKYVVNKANIYNFLTKMEKYEEKRIIKSSC